VELGSTYKLLMIWESEGCENHSLLASSIQYRMGREISSRVAQIGVIKHLLRHFHALSCKLSHNHIPAFWLAIYFAMARIVVAPKNI